MTESLKKINKSKNQKNIYIYKKNQKIKNQKKSPYLIKACSNLLLFTVLKHTVIVLLCL